MNEQVGPPLPPADRVETPSPVAPLPLFYPTKLGVAYGPYVWNGRDWTWRTGLRRDGYYWDGRAWVDPPPPRGPRHWSRNQKILAGVGAVALAAFLIVLSLTGGKRPGPSSSTDYRDAWYACRDAVSAQLKAPSTADFPWYDEAFITSSSTSSVTFGAYVDAQNSFGAQIRTNWQCTANRTGSGWVGSAYVQ